MTTNDKEHTARLERQLSVTQQLTHIGSWEWDVATNTVSWSDELYRIYGLEPKSIEITLETFLDHVHPEDRARGRCGRSERRSSRGTASPTSGANRPASTGASASLETRGEASRDARGKVEWLSSGRAVT